MLLEIMMGQEREAGLQEGLQRGLQQGRDAGSLYRLVEQCCRKLVKGQSADTIADALETELEEIQRIVLVAAHFAPDYDVDAICEELQRERQKKLQETKT